MCDLFMIYCVMIYGVCLRFVCLFVCGVFKRACVCCV